MGSECGCLTTGKKCGTIFYDSVVVSVVVSIVFHVDILRFCFMVLAKGVSSCP
jgi:hypothetical protein